MNKRLSIFCILIIIGAGMISCDDNSSKSKSSTADADSIKAVFNHLADSTSSAWKVMMDEDDQKLAYLQRLLDEVSYTKVFNKNAYDSLSSQVNRLKSERYDLNSMEVSENIDKYDSETSTVIYNVVSFAQNHPSFKDYPLMNELIRDIVEADNKVIYRRVDYDNAAIAYNKFLEKHKDILGLDSGKLNEKALFQLTE